MILRFLPHSPYARKVLVAAHELGQSDAFEVVTAHVFDPETPLQTENPLKKVPTLVLDDGQVLYDSTVICEWLDARDGGSRLFPAGEARWDALRLNALGDGLGQVATWNIRERYKPENERSDTYIAYYERTLHRSLEALDGEVGGYGDAFQIGQISVACALSYIDLRYPDMDWRAVHPGLGAWYDRACERPSMAATPLGPYDGPVQPW
jgi:glutathione S-transferase